jgi:GT2 family glycosyltransferase
MKELVIVSATTRGPPEFDLSPLGESLKRLYGVRRDIVYNNKRGLPEVYNEKLREYTYSDVILAFVHDDVQICDTFITEKLNKAHSDGFAVMGLAGCKNPTFERYDESKPSLMWHLMSEQKDRAGFVAHCDKDNTRVWSSSFGMSNKEVDMLDGLFLAFWAPRFAQGGVMFDERFTFHFYDLSFSLRARAAGLRMTTLPIFVVHHSIGQVKDPASFLADQAVFYQHYKDQLP